LERSHPDSVSTVPFCLGSPSDGSPNSSGTGTRAGVELAGVTLFLKTKSMGIILLINTSSAVAAIVVHINRKIFK